MIVGQGPVALAVAAGGGCLDIFTLNYPFFLLSPSFWETARYRLKYRLKGPLNPKQASKFTMDVKQQNNNNNRQFRAKFPPEEIWNAPLSLTLRMYTRQIKQLTSHFDVTLELT